MRFRSSIQYWLVVAFAVLAAPTAARAQATGAEVAWRLLDYMAVDYRGAVGADGQVLSTSEYAEMREFAGQVTSRIRALPPKPGQGHLVVDARGVEAAVARKASPDEVGRLAHELGTRLLDAYPVPLAPTAAPDLAAGARLYAETCASCHGATGRADTAAGRALDPHPVAFADRSRARERSIFALYQVIEQGLEGTAMQSFASLSPQDRWALAFHIGRFAYPEALVQQGRSYWESDATLRARIPNLQTLVQTTPATLATKIGEEKANAVMAFLRANPDVLLHPEGTQSLSVSHELLRQAVAAYGRGEQDQAGELALSAYLDGFEPVESLLRARDSSLVSDVEGQMGELRAAIARGAPLADITVRANRLQALFGRAETALQPEAGSGTSTFLGALTILVREGLEALLIVVAMIGFLRKAERRELLKYVHVGWVGALVAGLATWWIASNLIAIGGASRELTEGFGSLLAAAILLFVGIWMHGKAQAGAWQRYVRDKLDKALNSAGSAWFLFLLAFVAVYREVFETIIFFAALGGQGNGAALIGGIAVAIFLLGLVAWAMLKLSKQLPIAKFFAYSAALIAVLAVVLSGKGVAALQESGIIGVTPLAGFPSSLLLGIHPTLETVGAQVAMIVLLAAGFLFTQRRSAALAATA
jgi:high-affinity iron transporter